MEPVLVNVDITIVDMNAKQTSIVEHLQNSLLWIKLFYFLSPSELLEKPQSWPFKSSSYSLILLGKSANRFKSAINCEEIWTVKHPL
jgi:hypothetical protein